MSLMDFPFPFKNSFRHSHGSSSRKHSTRISAAAGDEEQPIHTDRHPVGMAAPGDPDDRRDREVIVMVDQGENIPASRNRQHHRRPLSVSRDVKVSFVSRSADNALDIESETSMADGEENEEGGSQHFQNRFRPPSASPDDGGGEVLRCTSFDSRRKSMLRTKTKSRLIDPQEPEPDCPSNRTGKSGQLRSGMLGRPSDEEDDDPLFDEDIPEDFRKSKLGALVILEWLSLILIVAALICTLAVPQWRKWQIRGLYWWKWELLILVLICGRLVSDWVIRIMVFFVERNFLLRKRILYFVYGLRKAVQNCIWLGLVLLAWHLLFDKRFEVETNNQFVRFVNKVLVCFLIGTLLWLVKTLMVKVLASSFHVSTFFDRIQESLFNQYVIETLSGPPLVGIPHRREDEERWVAELQKLQNTGGATLPPEILAPQAALPSFKNRGVIRSGNGQELEKPLSQKSRESIKKQDSGISIDHLHRLNTKNISAWNMKRLMRIVRHGALSTLEEQIMESTDGDESTRHIRSELEAKAAARKIFQNVAGRGSKFIYLQDIMRFMREDEALKTITAVVGSAEGERISKVALKNWVVNAFRERRALALTLNDTKTAVNKLHHMVNVIVGIVTAVVCVLILEVATSKFLLFLSSQIVVVAFIFGNTLKTIFEAIIFLFVMHPFDVGDRCEINGVQMTVEEMNILTTVFLRYDNQKIIYPNSTLSTLPISNYYRSPDMGDSIDFSVHIATPAEKIAITRQRITSYIESKKDHWYPSPTIMLMDLHGLNTVKVSIWLRHRMNHQDIVERFQRRELVIEEMVKIFKELDIEYRLLPLDINVRSMPTAMESTRMPSSWTASYQ